MPLTLFPNGDTEYSFQAPDNSYSGDPTLETPKIGCPRKTSSPAQRGISVFECESFKFCSVRWDVKTDLIMQDKPSFSQPRDFKDGPNTCASGTAPLPG